MVVKNDNRDFYTHLTNRLLPGHRWQSIARIIHFAAHSGKTFASHLLPMT
jgi:hypothetical protein